VGLATLMLLVAGCAGSGSDGAARPTPTAPTPTGATSSAAEPAGASPSPDLPSASPVDQVPGARTYDARPNPDWVVVAGGSAWVANVGKGVGRYDARTGRPRGSVGTGTEICTAMVAGAGYLWVVDCSSRRLFGIDLRTGKPASQVQLPLDGIQEEGALAVGDGSVFVVAAGGAEIARVDIATGHVDTFAAPPGSAGVRHGFGSLWVTNPGGESLARLDPRDGSVRATVPIAADAYFLDVGAGSVWVMANASSEVFRVDPSSNTVVATVDVSFSPVEGGDLTFGGGSVWARVSDVLVARIDPATNEVVARFGDARGSGSADGDSHALWISAHDVSAVYRVPVEPLR
jgi:streptogramin lyase